MIGRRDVLMFGACAGALGVAEYLRPREHMRLMGDVDLEKAVPQRVGPWAASAAGNIVTPTTPGSLADRLYSSTVTRNYRRSPSDAPMMLVIAYGASQSDLLQLHRPESCYPAVGYAITQRRAADVPVPGAKPIPAVELTAEAGGRIEDIVYWTRLGELMPRSAGEQRRDRLKTAMQGVIGDGVLVRASIQRLGNEPSFEVVQQFLSALVVASPSSIRRGLVGTERDKALA